ncbi:MAG: hypothetical protein ACRENH_17455 [Gemmatimonadaceae bacterium]
MDERMQKAFDFAQESTKQFIALSTGIIAVSITFSKDFVSTVDGSAKVLAVVSWGFFLFSVFCGLWVLMALTGTLEPNDPNTKPSIRGKNVTIPAGLQSLTFFIGLLLTVLFGIIAL